MKEISKSRISLVGLAAVVAILIIGGAVFAFMQATEESPEPSISSSQAGQPNESEVISAEELRSNVTTINEELKEAQKLSAESKKAVEDEKYRISVDN